MKNFLLVTLLFFTSSVSDFNLDTFFIPSFFYEIFPGNNDAKDSEINSIKNSSVDKLHSLTLNLWNPLGPDDLNGDSGFSSSDANYVVIATDGNDIPYVTYLNGTEIANSSMYAAKFENGSWQILQGTAFSAGHADFASMAIDGNGVPYIAYRDYANSAKATVHKFDGTWSVVGSAGFSASTANNTEIAIDGNNDPYIVYQDASTNFKATVKKFNGSSWVNVGGGIATGSSAQYTDIAIDGNNTPYIVFKDGGVSDKISVNTFNGSNWVTYGTFGFSTGAVAYTTIAIDGNNVVYVAYQDIANGSGISVKKWDGNNWVDVGSPSFSAGTVTNPSIAINSNNVPYVVYVDGANNNKITVEQFNGNSWGVVGTAGFSNAGVAFPSLAVDNSGNLLVAYGSPGAFAKSFSASALPISLSYFKVIKENSMANLSWQTEFERNNKGFHIQRRLEGKEWETIAFVKGMGTTNDITSYNYKDENPPTGINFYRLKQEDHDGNSEYSKIRSIVFEGDNNQVYVYPNPFKDYLIIENGEGKAKIYNLFGKLVKEQIITDKRYSISTVDLMKGSYILLIDKENGERVSFRIVN